MIELAFSNLPAEQLQFQIIASSIYKHKNIIFKSNFQTLSQQNSMHQIETPDFLNFDLIYDFYIKISHKNQKYTAKLYKLTEIKTKPNTIQIDYHFTPNTHISQIKKIPYLTITDPSLNQQSIFSEITCRIIHQNFFSESVLQFSENQFQIDLPIFIDENCTIEIYGNIVGFQCRLFTVKIDHLFGDCLLGNFIINKCSIGKDLAILLSVFTLLKKQENSDFLSLVQFLRSKSLEVQTFFNGHPDKQISAYLKKLVKQYKFNDIQCQFDTIGFQILFQKQNLSKDRYGIDSELIKINKKYDLVFSPLSQIGSVFSSVKFQNSCIVNLDNGNQISFKEQQFQSLNVDQVAVSGIIQTKFYFYQSVLKIKTLQNQKLFYLDQSKIMELGSIEQDYQPNELVQSSQIFQKLKNSGFLFSYYYHSNVKQQIQIQDNEIRPDQFLSQPNFETHNKKVDVYESTVQKNLYELEDYYENMKPQHGGSLLNEDLNSPLQSSDKLFQDQFEDIFPRKQQTDQLTNQQLILLEKYLKYQIPRHLHTSKEVYDYILIQTSPYELIELLSKLNQPQPEQLQINQFSQNSNIFQSNNQFIEPTFAETVQNVQKIQSIRAVSQMDYAKTEMKQHTSEYEMRKVAERIKWI